MSHVFISYSTHNRPYARTLADTLRAEGFDVWIDNRNLHTSEDWWRSIVLALRSCAAVIVVLTPESDSSRWVQREITLAEKYNKPMFPLLLDGDLNTPNWEIFVRIQVEDVRGGHLPPSTFYDYLGEFVSRRPQRGVDVTGEPAELPPDIDSADIAEEIANPPPPTEIIPPDSGAALRAIPPRRLRPGIIMLVVAVIVTAATLLVLTLLQNQLNPIDITATYIRQQAMQALAFNQDVTATAQRATEEEGFNRTATERALGTIDPMSITATYLVLVATQVEAINQTANAVLWTATPSPTLTPTVTPTLSGTEFELTVRAEVNMIQTEGVVTAQAQETATAAMATTFLQGTADALTATATRWTPPPTPDARQTAFARLTQTQAALIVQVTRDAIAALTQVSRDQTATATRWTATPTPTYTPSSTPTDTPTWTPVPTLALTPTPTPTYTPKPSATLTPTEVPLSTSTPTPVVLTVGNTVAVTFDTLNLRSAPGLSVENTIIKIMLIGEVLTLLEGPQEVDGSHWWKVRTEDAQEGWVIESVYDAQALTLQTLTPTPTDCVVFLLPAAPSLAVRVGPSDDRALRTSIKLGRSYPVTGQLTDESGRRWWRLLPLSPLPSERDRFWVADSDSLEKSGDCEAVPLASAPPIIPPN